MKKIVLSSLVLIAAFSITRAQNVGIGTNTPSEKLDVNGGIKIGATTNTAKGTIRWNETKNDFEGYNGVAWVSLTGGKSVWGSQQSYATENTATQISLLPSSNNMVGTQLGFSLSLSGTILAIGARSDASSPFGSQGSGSVYLYKKAINEWNYMKRIANPTSEGGDYFGSSVCFYNDNLIVGAPGVSTGNLQNIGKAYIYQHDHVTNQTTLRATLSASDADAHDWFGHSVAISNDHAVVGGPYNDIGNVANVGRVYTFRKDGNTWLQHNVITAPNGAAYDNFGYAVTISGNWLAASAYQADEVDNYDVGKVHLYKLNIATNAWEYANTLTPTLQISDARFGYSLDMNGDTLIVGATESTGSTNDNNGRAYVYHRNGDSWNLHSTLTAPDGNLSNAFGSAIRINDGYVIIGANKADMGANRAQGKAYIFKWAGNSYNCEAILASSNGSQGDLFGNTVAIGSAGAAVGAPNADYSESFPNNGRVYFFNK